MKSLAQMIAQCEGLLGTKDVTEWESEFLQNIVERTDHGKDTHSLTGRQVQIVERIYDKHFA